MAEINRMKLMRLERFERDYRAAIQPLFDTKLRIQRRLIPKIVIHEDGRVDSGYEIPPNIQEIIDYIDAKIEDCWNKYKKRAANEGLIDG